MKGKAARPRGKLCHLAELLPTLALSYVLRIFPRRIRWSLGRWAGSAFFLLDARHRDVTLANLDVAFGDTKTAEEKLEIARGAFRHFGAMLFEMISLGNASRAKIERMVELEGEDHYEKARSMGRGVIVVGAHFGNWEMNAIAHGYRFGRFFPVARALDNPYFNRWLERIRNLPGNEVVYKQNAVTRLMRLLKERQTVGLVVDQNVSLEDAVFVEFFGRKAATTPLAALLALKTAAMLVPIFAYPLPDGRYRCIYEEPIDPLDYSRTSRQQAVAEITQRCASVLESQVRRHPQFWLWMHRRWKTRPANEPRRGTSDRALSVVRQAAQSSKTKAGSS